jgi:hypothetical protein
LPRPIGNPDDASTRTLARVAQGRDHSPLAPEKVGGVSGGRLGVRGPHIPPYEAFVTILDEQRGGGPVPQRASGRDTSCGALDTGVLHA